MKNIPAEATPYSDNNPEGQHVGRIRRLLGRIATPRHEAETLADMEIDGFAEEAPIFSEQVTDATRTASFRYVAQEGALNNLDPSADADVREMSEHEGLQGLQNFLLRASGDSYGDDLSAGRLRLTAESILSSLTFIGEREYKTAARGIANLWSVYLERDPKAQILLANSMSEAYGKKKSDAHLFDEVMLAFSKEELERYRQRIVTIPEDVTTKPKHVRMIILDDWSVSGAQLRRAYKLMRSDERYSSYLSYAEVNLIVGTTDRLRDGLIIDPKLQDSHSVPVRAYYRAHHAPEAKEEHAAHVTGLHSSADYDFEKEVHTMVVAMNEHADDFINMPPLTNIVREYRYSLPGTISNSKK